MLPQSGGDKRRREVERAASFGLSKEDTEGPCRCQSKVPCAAGASYLACWWRGSPAAGWYSTCSTSSSRQWGLAGAYSSRWAAPLLHALQHGPCTVSWGEWQPGSLVTCVAGPVLCVVARLLMENSACAVLQFAISWWYPLGGALFTCCQHKGWSLPYQSPPGLVMVAPQSATSRHWWPFMQ